MSMERFIDYLIIAIAIAVLTGFFAAILEGG